MSATTSTKQDIAARYDYDGGILLGGEWDIVVHGQVRSVDDLPASASSGEVWHVTLANRLMIRRDNGWHQL